MGRRALSQSLLVLALASGCEGLKSFKQGLHDESATLRVEVRPDAGVTVLLDGAELGGASPFVRAGLPAGAHRLEVRAQGYHPFSTPVTLRAGQRLTVPLALRPLATPTDLAPTPAPPR